jgi:hypothetical protein
MQPLRWLSLALPALGDGGWRRRRHPPPGVHPSPGPSSLAWRHDCRFHDASIAATGRTGPRRAGPVPRTFAGNAGRACRGKPLATAGPAAAAGRAGRGERAGDVRGGQTTGPHFFFLPTKPRGRWIPCARRGRHARVEAAHGNARRHSHHHQAGDLAGAGAALTARTPSGSD